MRLPVRLLLVMSLLATLLVVTAAPAAAYPVVTFDDLDAQIAATTTTPEIRAELYQLADIAESAADSNPSDGCAWLDVFDFKVYSLAAKRRIGHRDGRALYETTYGLRVNLGCLAGPPS